MQISFIIPSYNHKDFIEDALASVATQKLAGGSFEVLIFDGGSTDGTIESLARHPLVDVFEFRPDGGQADAVNKGLKRARGEIIAWLNSDDAYLPSALDGVLQIFHERPEVDVIYGQAIDIDGQGRELGPTKVLPWSKASLLDSCIISQPACFFRKRFVERNGPLREDLHLTLDYEYWLRASDWAVFAYLPRPLAYNRIHPQAKSSRAAVEQMRESAQVVHAHSGQWRRAWLRRVASARARQFLKLTPDQDNKLRYCLSGLLYVAYWTRIRLGLCPF